MKLATAVTALSTVALTARTTNGEIVLQSAPPASKMVEGEYKVVCGGNADATKCCELRLQKDCNLVTRRKSTSQGLEDFEVNWDSGAHGGNLDCEVFLQGDGNLVIYRNKPSRAPVWATKTNSLDGLSHSYTLEFDSYERCRLQIKQDGTEETTDLGYPRFWWESIRHGGEVYPGVLLQRGEMIVDTDWEDEHYTMYLQHDCNLVIFVGPIGQDLANGGTPVWSTGTAGDAEECHLYGDCDKLVLYEGKFMRNKPPCAERGNRLWEMDWDEGGPNLCFYYPDGPQPC